MRKRRPVFLLVALFVPACCIGADALSDLNAAEHLWLNSRLKSYSYLIKVGGAFGAGIFAIRVTPGHCSATFKSGTGMYGDGLPPITCEYRTISDLFADLRRELEMEPTAVKEVRFNTTYGYPEHVYTDSELVDQSSTTDISHFKVSN